MPVEPGSWFSGVAVSPGALFVAVGGRDGRVLIFEQRVDGAGSSELMLAREIAGQAGPVMDLEFDLSGRFLVEATGAVRATTTWEVKTGRVVAREDGYIHPRSVANGLLNLRRPRARGLGTETVFKVPAEDGNGGYSPATWLPTSMGWLVPDMSGTQWVAVAAEHVCLRFNSFR